MSTSRKKHLSRVLQTADRHQWLSVLSGIPRSRATWDCDFPLLCHRCTASSLNSLVYVGLAFYMVVSFSGNAFSPQFTPSMLPGQDHPKEEANRPEARHLSLIPGKPRREWGWWCWLRCAHWLCRDLVANYLSELEHLMGRWRSGW
jgi:hypothetical protein